MIAIKDKLLCKMVVTASDYLSAATAMSCDSHAMPFQRHSDSLQYALRKDLLLVSEGRQINSMSCSDAKLNEMSFAFLLSSFRCIQSLPRGKSSGSFISP